MGNSPRDGAARRSVNHRKIHGFLSRKIGPDFIRVGSLKSPACMRFDHVASFIVNANHSIIASEIKPAEH
jgi:hypothetical protein